MEHTANAQVIYDDDYIEYGMKNDAIRSRSRSAPAPAVATVTPPPKPFFNFMNLLSIAIAVTIVFAAIFGTLAATGAFEGSKGEKSAQDNLSPDNKIPVAAPASPPVQPPIITKGDGSCVFLPGDGFDVKGDGTLFVKQFVDIVEETVTVEMTYNGIGWLGMAFSEQPAMIPNTAIIGLPDDNIVLKYSLSERSLAGVQPLEASKQTLTDASITQENGRTILTFTKKLVEDDEVAVTDGQNRFNWAHGSSNELAIHEARGSTSLLFDKCADTRTAAPAAASPVGGGVTYPPTYYPDDFVPTYSPSYSPSYTPTYYKEDGVPTYSPSYTPSNKPSYSPSSPTYAPVAKPTNYPVAAPTYAPVVKPTNHPVAPPTHAPVGSYQYEGTWSKWGNRRSCTKDTCPTKDASWMNTNVDLGYGCTCTDTGLNSCYWDDEPATVEWYTSWITLEPTETHNVWKLQYSGATLNLGEGGDNASGQACYDDPLRGGFRVDLAGTGMKFYDSKVTVKGDSPSMKMITNGNVVVDEWHSYNSIDTSYTMTIPADSTWIEVACGGWPGSCTSELYVTWA